MPVMQQRKVSLISCHLEYPDRIITSDTGEERKMSLLFIMNSAALGVGLAMDAFSVSLANGLHEPQMRKQRMCLIAGVYALFQFAMPMTGWICVHTIVSLFASFEKIIPWIALVLLLYIGSKMILEARAERNEPEEQASSHVCHHRRRNICHLRREPGHREESRHQAQLESLRPRRLHTHRHRDRDLYQGHPVNTYRNSKRGGRR